MSSNPMETSSSFSSPSAHPPSAAVMPSSPSSVHSRGDSSLRRRRRNRIHHSEQDGMQEANDSSSNVNNTSTDEAPPSPTSRNRRTRRQTRSRQNRSRQQQQQIPSGLTTRRTPAQTSPLPFIMPIWMAKKIDTLSNNRNNNHSSNNLASPRVTNGDGYITGAWRNFRNVLLGRGNNHSSYESVATTAQQLSIYQYSPGSSPSNHRDSGDNLGQNTPPRDVEQMHLGEEGLSLPILEENNLQSSPSSRSSEGLRRRAGPSTPRRARTASSNSSGSPMSSPARRSSPPSIPNTPNLSSSSSSTSSGGERAPASPPTVSLTQRAIQLQMRQAQMHSRGGSSEIQSDSDDESYDSDASSNDESSTSVDDSGASTSTGDADNQRAETGCSRKNVYGVMRMSFAVGIFHLFALVALHVTYIGPYAFRKPGVSRLSSSRQRVKRSLVGRLDKLSNTLGGKVFFSHNLLADETNEGQDTVTGQALVNCISYALSTRPENERSKYYAMFGDSDSKRRRLLRVDDLVDDDDDVVDKISKLMPTNTNRLALDRSMAESESTSTYATPFIGKDEILQIKIMFGGKCTGRCSRIRHVDYTNTTNSETAEKIRLLDQGLRGGNLFLRATNNRRNVEEVGNDVYSSPAFWEEPHYRFSMDDALLYLDEKSALIHNISVVNVTVTERCLSTGRDDGKLSFFTAIGEFMSQIYGMDSVIINQLMYGIRGSAGSLQSGYLLNVDTKERWGWTKQQLESYEGNYSVADWILNKIGKHQFWHRVALCVTCH